mgnify:CR=1 FL=1
MGNNNYESCEMCNFEIHKSILIVVSDTSKFQNGMQTGVWFEEFAIPYSAFIDKGYEVTTASPNGGQIPIDPKSINDKWDVARNVLNNVKRLNAVDCSRYNAIVLPGGHGPMFDLYKNELLGKILNDFDRKGKLIAAICHGPAGLLSAPPVIKNRKLTCYTNEEEFYSQKDSQIPYFLEDALKNSGALFVQNGIGEVNVVEDRNLITAQNYNSTGVFTQKILEYMEKF